MWGAERPGTPTSVETMFVKICGITCVEDALLATALGADGVGFVFAPSGRKVAAPAVEDIVRQLPHEMMTVGVFRDQGREQVVKTSMELAYGPPRYTVTKALKTAVG